MKALVILAATPQQQNPWMSVVMLLMIVVVFYFFMIRPQQKRSKEQKMFREALKKGDKIITSGGIFGKVAEIGNRYILIDVEGGMKLKIDKSAIHKDLSDAEGEVK
jgi:preprotein translocase subunit YajC